MDGGTTVLFVSQNIEQIREMCDHDVWLEHDSVKMNGTAKDMCAAYESTI